MLQPHHPHRRSIISQLNQSLEQAEALYASVCFWSIGPGVLSHCLEELLARPGSFCIADIHPPTNVDRLHQFQELGSRVYLFFKELQPTKPAAHLQRHLLHTKMLLLDMPDGHAELWVGSHNFTKQALRGVNREATLVLPCYQNDALYGQALTYLHSILQDEDCRPFDPNLLDTYKRLQGLPKDEIESGPYFLPVAWDSTEMSTLAQQLILLVGPDSQEYAQFGNLDREGSQLAIRAHDLAGGPIRYFAAKVYSKGPIEPADPGSYDIEFGERNLAVRNGTQLPLVAPAVLVHSRDTLRRFRYHVSIRILHELPADLEFAEADLPAEAAWRVDHTTNELLRQTALGDDLDEYRNDASRAEQTRPASRQYPAGSPTRTLTWQESQAAHEVGEWLTQAQRRRYRPVPVEPSGLRAVFYNQSSANHLPASFAALDEQFQPDKLPALRADFEQPLRDTFYRDDQRQLSAPDASRGPQVRKLLQRYRLR